jgi:hypothetical protein
MKSFEKFLDENSEYSMGWRLRSSFVSGYITAKYEVELNQFMEKHPEVSIDVSFSGITAICKTREILADFLLIFGGKWDKKINDYDTTLVDYSQQVTIGEGKTIMLLAASAPLPPSCHVEEVEELIPAQTRKVKKIICGKGESITSTPVIPTTNEII